MRRTIGFCTMGLMFVAGCNQQADTTADAPSTGQEAAQPSPAAHAEAAATEAAATEAAIDDSATDAPATSASASNIPADSLVAITDGKVQLDPSNTHIGWTGTHVGDDPKPRVGSFEKFTGTAEIDPAAKSLKSVSIEIETASLKAPIANLTTHLNSPDFFDTREYPKATFKSTSIKRDAGQTMVTGDLTLHGVTKEITFPATVAVTDAGMGVKAEFTIDRTDFNLGKNQAGVEKDVQVNVTVGKQADVPAAASSP